MRRTTPRFCDFNNCKVRPKSNVDHCCIAVACAAASAVCVCVVVGLWGVAVLLVLVVDSPIVRRLHCLWRLDAVRRQCLLVACLVWGCQLLPLWDLVGDVPDMVCLLLFVLLPIGSLL